MNNVASLKTSSSNSPKTAGGISKSLLTPCRRIGLSRNWKKSGSSPFISPLAGNAYGNQDVTEKNSSPAGPNVAKSELSLNKTPSRNVSLPRKRKSKILLAAISSSETTSESQNESLAIENDDKLKTNIDVQSKPTENVVEKVEAADVSTPIRTKSKSKTKKILRVQSSSKDSEIIENTCNAKENYTEIKENINEDSKLDSKEKSPNELKKKCIVVIQRKIFKDENKKCHDTNNSNISAEEQHETKSQTLFDSDSDDTPLCKLNKLGSQNSQTAKNETSQKLQETSTLNEDDDFVEHKSKIRKLNTITTNKVKQKNESKKKKIETTKIINIHKPESSDDEDFEFDNKRTILIRKTYDKVTKPLKAKSTGSISQKDIDELKARIEVKKKILLAKIITEDTKELRDLIKKWQKGCQDALLELMDLMKSKFPEKSNMAYSEILESLHIPASLVGYDSENDCFNTPDDASIILSNVDL